MSGRLYFVEPSKVKHQHIVLTEGYLRAIRTLPLEARFDGLTLLCHESLQANLPQALLAAMSIENIPVLNPEDRQLVRKTLLEVAVVHKIMRRMKQDDMLFVTCVLSPALWMLEKVKRFYRSRNVVICLHNELEGLYDPGRLKPTSYGYWGRRWLDSRSPDSTLQVAVIDDFIRDRIIADFPEKLRPDMVHSLPYPVAPWAQPPQGPQGVPALPTFCFIGFKMKFKGFGDFAELAAQDVGARFVAIGGGVVEDVRTGEVLKLGGTDDFLNAVASTDIAIFPYVDGYHASMSAAAIDALATGTHLLATPRECFVSLQQHLGPDYVTICPSISAMGALLSDRQWVAARSAGRQKRLAGLQTSRYAHSSTARAFARMLQIEEARLQCH